MSEGSCVETEISGLHPQSRATGGGGLSHLDQSGDRVLRGLEGFSGLKAAGPQGGVALLDRRLVGA